MNDVVTRDAYASKNIKIVVKSQLGLTSPSAPPPSPLQITKIFLKGTSLKIILQYYIKNSQISLKKSKKKQLYVLIFFLQV